MAKPPLSIPDSELDVLKVLWERGQATVREVLETLRAAGHVGNKEGKPWSYATVATLLDRLETKGLLRRVRSSEDRRVVNLELTDSGRTAAQQIPDVLCRVQNAHMKGFSQAEWQTLKSLLRRILENALAIQAEQEKS